MQAKKCDRCGVYYGAEYKTGLDAIAEAVAEFSRQIRKITDRYGVVDAMAKGADLCPKCRDSLDTWFRVGGCKDGK